MRGNMEAVAEILALWLAHFPDLRFGQYLDNAMADADDLDNAMVVALYYVEDEELLGLCREFARTHGKNRNKEES